MSKIKLTFDELSKVCGTSLYLTMIGFDEHQPAAVVTFPGNIQVLFNLGKKEQIEQIKNYNPDCNFYGTFYISEVDEQYIQRYRYWEIRGW